MTREEVLRIVFEAGAFSVGHFIFISRPHSSIDVPCARVPKLAAVPASGPDGRELA